MAVALPVWIGAGSVAGAQETPVVPISIGQLFLRDDSAAAGATWGYTLEEASEGTLAVRVRLGTGIEWSSGRPPLPGG